MCLELTEDSARLKKNFRRRKGPIVAYKLLNLDNTSCIKNFLWKDGLNISSRKDTALTPKDILFNEVNEGFHFFFDIPKDCPYYDQCQCLNRYPCRYRHLCRCRCIRTDPVNKVAKFHIDPKDVVAVGEWGGRECLVATKARMI
jgi:hypothetical protein